MQVVFQVYSEAARVQRFHRSLLERLFHHYQSYEASLRDASPLTIMLSQNYRTQQQILQFIAQVGLTINTVEIRVDYFLGEFA